MTIKLDTETLKFIALFERITRAKVKDCFFTKDKLTFVVEEGELGKALGKNKSNLYRLEGMFKRRLKIVEYAPSAEQFIVNLIKQLTILGIATEDKLVTIKGADSKTKGLIIGARAQNLRRTEEIAKKYFDIEEIKVV
jgi:N utilization substance protein A